MMAAKVQIWHIPWYHHRHPDLGMTCQHEAGQVCTEACLWKPRAEDQELHHQTKITSLNLPHLESLAKHLLKKPMGTFLDLSSQIMKLSVQMCYKQQQTDRNIKHTI